MHKLDLKGEELEIFDIQQKEEASLLDKDNVVGVGIGNKIKDGKETGDKCLTVLVSQKLDKSIIGDENFVPANIGKHKTDIVEVGEIFAGGTSLEEKTETLRKKMRPAKGGYSVGHYKITAGTIATGVYDIVSSPGIPKKYYILSNNHVLANSNNAKIGDPILQPGPYDGGTDPGDVIAKLSRYIAIKFGGPDNYVDAAIAEANFQDIDRQIYWIGYAKDTVPVPRIGTIVQKTGRTTNYTTGKITAINTSVNVNYGGGKIAKFARQIVTTNMSAGGDSGSLLLDMNENVVGLLFAGSSRVTIYNDMRDVQSLLGIELI